MDFVFVWFSQNYFYVLESLILCNAVQYVKIVKTLDKTSEAEDKCVNFKDKA